MNETSETLVQKNLKDTHNATSSQESVDGLMHSNLQDGLLINPSGQEVVHANLSPRQAQEAGLLTSGIYGPLGTGSLKSANLSFYLANKLRQRVQELGSTLYKLTWKKRTTPRGLTIYAVVASVRPISDSVFIGWPTAQVFDATNNGMGRMLRIKTGHLNLETLGTYRGELKDWILLAGWPTSRAQDSYERSNKKTIEKAIQGQAQLTLSRAVRGYLSGWPTTTVTDMKASSGSNPKWNHNMTMTDATRATAWFLEKEKTKKKKILKLWKMPIEDLQTESGLRLTGFFVETDGLGPLNPAHSRWIMGYPKEWDVCAVMETQ